MLRSTYQEAAGIALVPADEYDVLFMTSPDVYLASSLAREDLLAAAEPGALLTGSDFFSFGGLPNNFFFGHAPGSSRSCWETFRGRWGP